MHSVGKKGGGEFEDGYIKEKILGNSLLVGFNYKT
jgi:hypothetical protein